MVNLAYNGVILRNKMTVGWESHITLRVLFYAHNHIYIPNPGYMLENEEVIHILLIAPLQIMPCIPIPMEKKIRNINWHIQPYVAQRIRKYGHSPSPEKKLAVSKHNPNVLYVLDVSPKKCTIESG